MTARANHVTYFHMFLLAWVIFVSGTSTVYAVCAVPPVPPNAVLTNNQNSTVYNEGDKVTLTCLAGYKGSTSYVDWFCINGNWSGIQIVCSIVDCKMPTAISNGNVSLTSGKTTYTSVATITCISGYVLSGTSNITCQSTGIWSKGGSCQKLDCGDPVPPTHGNITYKTGTRYLDTATVICDVGYNSDITSSASILCSAASTWTPAINCIIVDCGQLTASTDGTITLSNGTTYGSLAKFSCNFGFTLNGSPSLVCAANGRWNGTAPFCDAIDCGQPPAPLNGDVKLVSNNTLILAQARQTCHPGYTAKGPSPDVFCLETGWTAGITCNIKDCGNPAAVRNGQVTLDVTSQTVYRSTATKTCNSGYKIDGNSTIVCLASGIWSNGGSCEKIDCGPPQSPGNGTVRLDTGSTNFRSTATQSCNNGYTQGSGSTNTISCQSTGFWEAGITCKPKDCGPPPAPGRGSVSLASNSTTFLSKATQACNVGYKPVGPSADLFCLDYGWSTNLTGVHCQIIDCKSPRAVRNGTVKADTTSTTYRSTATVTCNPGYNITGNATLECLSSGLWSTPNTCEKIDCGAPPIPKNGTVMNDAGSTLYRSTATQRCDDGYTAVNATTFTVVCLETGQWEEGITCTLKRAP